MSNNRKKCVISKNLESRTNCRRKFCPSPRKIIIPSCFNEAKNCIIVKSGEELKKTLFDYKNYSLWLPTFFVYEKKLHVKIFSIPVHFSEKSMEFNNILCFPLYSNVD